MVIFSETKVGIDVKTVGMYCLMHCFADVVRIQQCGCNLSALCHESACGFLINIFEKKSGVLSLITL